MYLNGIRETLHQFVGFIIGVAPHDPCLIGTFIDEISYSLSAVSSGQAHFLVQIGSAHLGSSEEVPFFAPDGDIRLNIAMMKMELWQDKALIRVSQVRWLFDRDCPRRNPLPEVFCGMSLQTIMAALHAVIEKPAHQHLRRWHDAQELSVIADLHHIVGRGSGGTAESIRGMGECLDQGTFGFAHIAFEDRTLIKDNTYEVVRIEMR